MQVLKLKIWVQIWPVAHATVLDQLRPAGHFNKYYSDSKCEKVNS